ncbi:MDR/zinc-dependent alcohol dehydrogenase-like family protein [Geomonas subterranea]|uniref:Zinc-binding dehydrogenase n=1 Tax=Geomonas subterranea TaxID=2847989 RepID=A0ABX8LLU3_9BACT|nr:MULTISPECIES: zinc-binding dehydrogenase [Geomonas]QXE91604.1 zinc-binding dehydrogenase [Geomonas subterranea]QXM10305.1 zinc-binding dehydrogenase [Geomonas subterranea]
MSEMMQAAVITGPGVAAVQLVPRPEPGAGEVLVAMEGCGVCASNLPLWQGRTWFDYPALPGAPGHEGWGRVQALGAGVQGVRVGDRVTFLSYNAYAQYDRVQADALVKIPASLDGQPFPGEPVGCAMNVFRRSAIEPGQTVVLIGAGFLGAIFTALATARGARVIAISRRGFALELARRCGAEETVILDDHQRVMERVRQLAGERGCDRVVEATGHQWPLDLAGELVREGGKIVIAGYHQDGLRQVNVQLWNWKGIDVINAHERDPRVYLEGMRAGIAAVESKMFPLKELITHSFSLEELGRAYQALEGRPDGFLKAMIRIEQ